MTVKTGHFIIDETFRWPNCAYCEKEGTPMWRDHSALWLCEYYKELWKSGWLDLVLLVKEIE